MVTDRDTSKFADLLANPHVSVLVDNRLNRASDVLAALALSAQGSARVVSDETDPALRTLFLERHPQLEAFVNSARCSVFAVEVSQYRLVSQFEAVQVLRMDT
jgi:hypothetical protein